MPGIPALRAAGNDASASEMPASSSPEAASAAATPAPAPAIPSGMAAAIPNEPPPAYSETDQLAGPNLQQVVDEIPTASYHDADPAELPAELPAARTASAGPTENIPDAAAGEMGPPPATVAAAAAPPSTSASPLIRSGSSRANARGTPPLVLPSPAVHPLGAAHAPHMRRPSSSLSMSSRRSFTPPSSDPNFPQRLPRPTTVAESAYLTEMHQELEAEQEAQVNRLLHMLRLQEQAHAREDANSSTGATVGSGNGRQRTDSHAGRSNSQIGSPVFADNVSEAGSVGSSWIGVAGAAPQREVGFNLAETQMLKRENDMLKRRIRELERQVADLVARSATGSTTTPSSEAGPTGLLAQLDGVDSASVSEVAPEDSVSTAGGEGPKP